MHLIQLQQMLMRNAISGFKNANCLDFKDDNKPIIPLFHTIKHKSTLIDMSIEVEKTDRHEKHNR